MKTFVWNSFSTIHFQWFHAPMTTFTCPHVWLAKWFYSLRLWAGTFSSDISTRSFTIIIINIIKFVSTGGHLRHAAAYCATQAADWAGRLLRPREGPQLEGDEGHRVDGRHGQARRWAQWGRSSLHQPLHRLQHDVPGQDLPLPHLQLNSGWPHAAVLAGRQEHCVHHHQHDAGAVQVGGDTWWCTTSTCGSVIYHTRWQQQLFSDWMSDYTIHNVLKLLLNVWQYIFIFKKWNVI